MTVDRVLLAGVILALLCFALFSQHSYTFSAIQRSTTRICFSVFSSRPDSTAPLYVHGGVFMGEEEMHAKFLDEIWDTPNSSRS